MKGEAHKDGLDHSILRFVFLKPFRRYLCLALIILGLICLLSSPCPAQYFPLFLQQAYPLLTIPRFIPNQVIIHFEPGTNLAQILSIYTLYGLKQISVSPISGARVVLTPPIINFQELIVRLNMEAVVLLAEPNYIGQVSFVPNDPFYRYQWHLKTINLENAWDLSSGLGVTVAVLDTGTAFESFDIYAQAPDLSGTRFVAGWDFVNGDANPDDDSGHGTHITGTIAQTTNNIYGCAGVAFNSTIMPVKVMDSDGNGTLADIVDGIYFAVNNGAQVINMSFGFGDNPTLSLETAVNFAYDNGATMVCSAGNKSTDLPNYPASYPICISVSGVRYDLTLGDYSNYGPDIDVCAPGGDLDIDQNLDGYPDGILQQSHDGTDYTVFNLLLGRGTSWSAAHVTGVIALMQSLSGGLLTPLQVDQILKQTAVDLGSPGWDQYYGYGLVDAYAALLATTQATIATAESIFASNLLMSSYLPIIPVPQIVNPFAFNQIQPAANPTATINGDLFPVESTYSLPFLQSLQSYSSLLSGQVYPTWSGISYNPALSLSGYPFLSPFSLPFQIPAGENVFQIWRDFPSQWLLNFYSFI